MFKFIVTVGIVIVAAFAYLSTIQDEQTRNYEAHVKGLRSNGTVSQTPYLDDKMEAIGHHVVLKLNDLERATEDGKMQKALDVCEWDKVENSTYRYWKACICTKLDDAGLI